MKNSFEYFHQEINLNSQEAFVLSNPIKISFPKPTELKPSIFSTLASYVNFSKQNPNPQLQKQFIPIPNQFFLMVNGNSIRIFKHWQTDDEQLQCEMLSQISLSFNLKCVKVSPFIKYQKNKGFYLLAEQSLSTYLQTLYYNPTEQKIQQIRVTRIPSKINCWSFVNNRQILIWCQNMKLYHYEMKEEGLNFIQSLDTQIKIQNEAIENDDKTERRSKSQAKNSFQRDNTPKKTLYNLEYSTILGQRGRYQESTIVIFYVLYNSQLNKIKIKCKQIVYPLEDSENSNKGYSFLQYKRNDYPTLILNPKIFEIASHRMTASPEVLRTIEISQLGSSYLARFQFQIIVIQKKFQKEYFAIDNIYKTNKQCSVLIAYNSNIISSITGNVMEINKLDIQKNKVNTSMVDFIDIDKSYQAIVEAFNKTTSNDNTSNSKALNLKETKEKSVLYSQWVSTDLLHQQHRKHIYFVFEVPYLQGDLQKKAYFLYMTKHTSRIKKIVSLAQNAEKPEQVTSVQKLGQTLGISEQQFYYNMWKSSKRGVDDIFSYLIKCKDYRKIIGELKGVLRKKTYAATRVQKILQMLQQSNLTMLKKTLTEENLIDYFHVIFVTRKIQIYESNFQLDEKQFTQMTDISLFNLVWKIINLKIYPKIKSTSVWAAEVKKSAKLNLIQVFDLFKFPLLQQYDVFLTIILNRYPNSLLKVVQNFPQLLPHYPFEDLVQPQDDNKQQLVTENQINRSPSFKQRQFFSSIKQSNIKSESNFLDNIQRELHPYFTTSLIKKSFLLAMERSEIKGQKYCFHTIINVKKQEYKVKIKNLSTQNKGLYLYLVVLDCLIKAEYQDKMEPELKEMQEKQHSNSNLPKEEQNSKIQKEQQNIENQSTEKKQDDDSMNDDYFKIKRMCEIFRSQHNLPFQVENQLITTSCLFRLMIEHSIIDIDQYNLWDIASEPMQKWVALFFLGNKQEKDLIFTQFMDIFKDNPDKFIQTMKNFIDSEHCSKVELSILISLINNMGRQFQLSNQKIIQLILDGFCARVQISDVIDANNFNQHLKQIQFSPSLLIKADKIEKLGVCRKIFSAFYLEQTLLKELLENTIQVLNRMLENFFLGKIKDQQKIKLDISQKKIKKIQVKSIQDVFQILHYLQQNMLFDLSAEQLIKTYCKKLIEWQTFDQIHELLYQSDYVQQYELDLKIIIMQIQTEMLQQLHSKQNFTYTQRKNKEFVKNILDIDRENPQTNPVVMSELAKMKISDIFLEWKYIIKSKEIEQMCEMWQIQHQEQSLDSQSPEEKKDLMNKIIQTYSEHLNVRYLEDLCKYFTIAATKKPENNPRNQKFYRYCTSLCDALLVKQKYKEACQLVCIIDQFYQKNYSMMSQCMLKSLIEEYVHRQVLNQILCTDQSQIHTLDHFGAFEQNQEQLPKEFQAAKKSENIERYMPNQNFQNSEEYEYQQQPDPLLIAKAYIDTFIENWQKQDEQVLESSNQNLKIIFEQYFPRDIEQLSLHERKSIEVHPDLVFNSEHGELQLSYLWEIILNISGLSNLQIKKEDVIYAYFFMQMGLVEPSLGFEEIQYIGYNHESIVKILGKFMDIFQKNAKNYKMQFLNYSIIFKRYLDALTKILVLKYHHLSQIQMQGEDPKQKEKVQGNIFDRVNLSVVREEFLKNGLYKDDYLSKNIEILKQLTIQAEKNCKNRLAMKSYSVKNCKLFNSKLKMTMKRGEKQAKAKEIQKEDEENENIQQQHMSFDMFKKLKNKVKNDNSFSEIGISQRKFAESMFGIGEGKKKSRNDEMKTLRELIQMSKREIEQKEKEQEERRKMQMNENLLKHNSKKAFDSSDSEDQH